MTTEANTILQALLQTHRTTLEQQTRELASLDVPDRLHSQRSLILSNLRSAQAAITQILAGLEKEAVFGVGNA